jgi:hypothetical protein
MPRQTTPATGSSTVDLSSIILATIDSRHYTYNMVYNGGKLVVLLQ